MCDNTQSKDPTVSFHRIPKNIAIRATWLKVFELSESDIKASSRVCSRHFPNGDVRKAPNMTLGKSEICVATSSYVVHIGRRFASPAKPGARTDRARNRDVQKFVKEHSSDSTPSSSISRSVTPASTPETTPDEVEDNLIDQQDSGCTEVLVHIALLARIEILESENARLKQNCKEKHF